MKKSISNFIFRKVTIPAIADNQPIRNRLLAYFPITFFDEQGRYDADAFMKELNKYVSKDKEFAVICRTGSRSAAVTELLSKQGYKVVNLKGGIKSLIQKGYTPTPYNP